MTEMIHADVVIIGAGAAGLMCALQSAQRGCIVVLIEHAEAIGKKIRISGGGRCNFTNRIIKPENYLSQNPHFCRSALARYTTQDFIDWIEQNGVSYHEKKLGQLFCDHSATDILELFESELRDAKVRVYLNTTVNSVTKHSASMQNADELGQQVQEQFDSGEDLGAKEFYEIVAQHKVFRSKALVIASGGLSIPKMGATDFGYSIARQFGVRLVQARPALVPLVVVPALREFCSSLAGLSFDTIASCNNMQFREHALFTHRGLSGPAILQISSYWQPSLALQLNLVPDVDMLSILSENSRSAMELKTLLSQVLPKRLADAWCEHEISSKPMKHYNVRELEFIADRLEHWEVGIDGTEGFAKAEVTVGGVDTRDLSSKTMQCVHHSGLYFIGEVVDVTGWLGGYNFQWAWASGVAAARAIAEARLAELSRETEVKGEALTVAKAFN